MCYHALYLYLACGHSISSASPLTKAPPCPAATLELFRRPSLASPISPTSSSSAWSRSHARNHSHAASRVALGQCHEKLAHPLHTFLIEGLCADCTIGREQRLARFEVGSIKSSVERDFARRRGEEHTRMKKSLKMMREAERANREAARMMESDLVSGNEEGYMESIGRLMEGVKERMLAWDQSLSPEREEGRRGSWAGEMGVGGRH